ncbi:tripartite tricarboxylate transporter substrate binding protein [Cupriavidus basilensis]|uniref:Tripartite tricarboxylate transporter substrate binding protein n=1 Tax=Cupriavidus basilensis TaxID=68895 RepID=A0ABT6AQA3_9BURK|nr:tripartite tricarboxylate transporter substrate binding protein [Cupriavidus basilensis]MDF3834800.1 tripartite tricarboxylate transporter substrate binding protein [Cupriavidus basilensis]
MNRKSFLRVTVGALCAVVLTQAHSETYPDKAIRFIVPWPAGGAADAVGRLVAQALTTQLGQTVYVENIAGAGGNIGTAQFVRSKPDGYTLYLATSSTNAASPHLYKRTGFEPIKDFTPIASVAAIPSILVVPAASPFKTPKDIIDAAKAKPGKLSYGSGGVGASAHLAGELFKSIAGIDVIHVPYKGSGPAISDVMAGQLSYMLDTGAVPYIRGGKVRAIAVAADKRLPLFPEVPTFTELGIKGMQMNAWYGVAAPAGTPEAVVTRVNAAINKALQTGALPKQLADIGAEVRTGSPADFSKFWGTELQRYEKLVKLTGATLD